MELFLIVTLLFFLYYKFKPSFTWISQSKMLLLYYNSGITRKYFILWKE